MRYEEMYRGRWLVIILLFCIWCSGLVVASEIPDMKGSWDGISLQQYSEGTGYEDRPTSQGPYDITAQEGRAFAGEETYSEISLNTSQEEVYTETIAAVLSADAKRFWQDHDGSGLSFGEMVSDHEFYNYMLFPADGPMVVVSHMVKNGTQASSELKPVSNLTGTWNFTPERRDGGTQTHGIVTIADQRDRIFTGTVQATEEDGKNLEVKIIGAVGSDGNVYAIASNGALYLGNTTGDHTMHLVIVHPQDDDKTYVIDGWSSRDDTTLEKPDIRYPSISGDWIISDRKLIQNKTITDKGPISDEWMSYPDQSGQFFSAVRHSQESGMPPQMNVSGILKGSDEGYLASGSPHLVIYEFPDSQTIEAIVLRKEEIPTIYMDILHPKTIS